MAIGVKQLLDECYEDGFMHGSEHKFKVDEPTVIPELKVDTTVEAQVATGLQEIYLPIPQGKFPSGRVKGLTRLAYWYSLRNEVARKLEDMDIKSDQAIADYPLMGLITILIQEYQVPLEQVD